jgi:hypothetical protein
VIDANYYAMKPCGCVVEAVHVHVRRVRRTIDRWLARGWTVGRCRRAEAQARLTRCTCEPSPALAYQLELQHAT